MAYVVYELNVCMYLRGGGVIHMYVCICITTHTYISTYIHISLRQAFMEIK